MPSAKIDIDAIPDEQIDAALARAEGWKQKRRDENQLARFKPYPRQLEFLSSTSRETLLMAANQSGKTYCGGMAAAIHLTGRYPDWWRGHRFDKPVNMWACGVTGAAVRDVLQPILLGPPGRVGCGSIPKDAIVDIVNARGIPGLIDFITVKHISGGLSRLTFKSYEMSREAFQGASLHVAWADEECDPEIYMELLTRTNATNGVVYMTFTPLRGVSEVVRRFLHEKSDDRSVHQMIIDEAEHISAEKRAQIIASYPPHELEARTKGVPVLGSGRIFPIAESLIVCKPRDIPSHWVRIGGIDWGYQHPAAAVECAIDRDNDTFYVIRSFRAKEQTIIMFAAALRHWGRTLRYSWPADGKAETMVGAGVSLAQQMRDQGLALLPDHATDEQGSTSVWSGLTEMHDYMKSGRFKVFEGQNDWLEEFRLYHHKDGKVVALGDDLLAATRYAFVMRRYAQSQTGYRNFHREIQYDTRGWL
jgi:phage terminase large subunit-like protein